MAAYYYLRILVVMYMHEPGESMTTLEPVSLGISLTLWASALGTLFLGIFPSSVLAFARSSSALMK